MRYTLTILEEQMMALRRSLFRDKSEYGGLLLCGRSQVVDPWTDETEERAIVREVVDVPASAFKRRTRTSMTWSTTPIYNLAKKAKPQEGAICTVHSHPAGEAFFSEADNVADKESLSIVFNRCESDRPHFSMVLGAAGDVSVRAYGNDLKPKPVDLLRVIGQRYVFGHAPSERKVPPEFDRQVRLFGAGLTEDLTALRIAVVGCGGTGSAVASLLARLGVGKLVLVDTDNVDTTNLNRLHFSSRSDAVLRRPKVDVVAEGIAKVGLTTSVVRLASYVDSIETRDALLACDVIFGCTDDHLGRNYLNRVAYFYEIPVIDLGVLVEPNASGGYDVFDGRVTVVQPGYPCQICRKLINSDRMHEESLRRSDPQRYEEYERAGYVGGRPDPSPAVVTYTTETATMAVNEFLNRLTGYRGALGECMERVRRYDEVKDTDTSPGCNRNLACKLCARRGYDGRGDMEPFLDMVI